MSDDKGSAVKGGELPWFGANRMVPVFIKQVSEFKTIGEVSKPVQTMYGWHIVKFLGQKPVGSFESVKNEIKDRLKKDVRSEKGRQSKIAQVKKEEGFTENPQALQELIALLDTTLLQHKFDMEKAKGFTQKLFTIGNESYNQYQLVDYIQKSGKKASITDYKKYTYKKYQEFVDNKVIEYEDRHLEMKYKEFAILMNEYKDGILLFDLMDEVVWSKAVKDTAGYQNYYKQHQSEYNWGKRVDASIFTFTNPDVFATVQGLIQLKKADEDILAEINNDSLKAVKFERRKFAEGDNKDVDETKWKAGSYKVFENEQGTPLTLVRIHEKMNPAPKTLDECRGMVISDYQNQLEKEWVDSLRMKYPVVIDQTVLEDIKKNGLTK
jgi:peptidyl-prolyl cis-trans isomerase SurA